VSSEPQTRGGELLGFAMLTPTYGLTSVVLVNG